MLASLDCLAENIGVQSVVVPELELGDVQRQIFAADFVKAAHNAALDEGPKALNCVRMNRANGVLAFAVVNGFVAGSAASIGHSRDRRQCKAGLRVSRRFRGRTLQEFRAGVFQRVRPGRTLALDRANDSGISEDYQNRRQSFRSSYSNAGFCRCRQQKFRQLRRCRRAYPRLQ